MTLKEVRKNKFFQFFSNRYVLILMVFIVWMIFFDENSYFVDKEFNDEIDKLEADKEFYQTEIDTDKKKIEKLEDPEELDEYAREEYNMKKEDEDIYIIMLCNTYYFKSEEGARGGLKYDELPYLISQSIFTNKITPQKIPISKVIIAKLKNDISVKTIIKEYQELKKKTDTYLFDIKQLNKAAYFCLDNNKQEEALTLFNLNVKEYPDNWIVHDGLGEYYFKTGNREKTIEYFKNRSKKVYVFSVSKNDLFQLRAMTFNSCHTTLMVIVFFIESPLGGGGGGGSVVLQDRASIIKLKSKRIIFFGNILYSPTQLFNNFVSRTFFGIFQFYTKLF